MKTLKVKTSDLVGSALDWVVAKCEGVGVEYINDGITQCLLRVSPSSGRYRPSTDWAQGGPIIDRDMLCVNPDTPRNQWMSTTNSAELLQFGPTPLIAAMRCYVASKLGDEVEIPEKVTQ